MGPFWPKVDFSCGKTHCAAPETPRLEHRIEPDTWLGLAGFQAGGPTTRPDLHGLGDGTMLANFEKIVEAWEMVK